MTGYLWCGQPGLREANAEIIASRTGKEKPGMMADFSWPMAPPSPPGHGSWSRWRLHVAAGEEPCERCAKWVAAHPEAPARRS